jgi:hypothetical protein
MIILVLQVRDWEYYLTIVAFPISIGLLLLGWISGQLPILRRSSSPSHLSPSLTPSSPLLARKEFRVGFAAFAIGLWVGLAYFVYKTIRIWQGIESSLCIGSLHKRPS